MIPLRNKSQNLFLKNPMLKLLTELNSLDTNNVRNTKSFAVSKSDSGDYETTFKLCFWLSRT